MMNLSIFEQSPRLREVYTQLCFCYPVANGGSQTAIVETLRSGLERLTANFPWVAGQVINKGASKGNSGTYKISPFGRLPHLVVKDLTDENSQTMDALREANFPFSMLNEKVICPRMTLAGGPGETLSDPAPVLVLQANFINGGLLLTIVASHSTMDIVGQVQMIRLLSKACRDEPFTEEEVRNGNLDRRNLIPLLDDTLEPDSKTISQTAKPAPLQHTSNDHLASPAAASLIWAYFAFKPTSLAALKALATSSITIHSTFISTDDALSALIWQSIVRARLARLNPATDSIFTRNVDLRRYVSIPSEYSGNMSTKTKHIYTLQQLANQSLGDIASHLRSQLDPETLKQKMYDEAKSLANTRDRSARSQVDRTKYIVMSSWSKVDCYGLDFNLGLGKPEAVRRPQFSPVEGVVYLLPKTLDGGIVAGLCLREDDMEKLKVDEEFVKYGQYIG
ncbi:putative trichothecene 3-O-acetyltransferase [Stipitochalara longipes BDJ]|nr:putative trichothecene 3-O-acetyltransferase [Stipitochalara longipes BDJ]